MTPLLDTIIEAFLEFKVPAKWGFAYPSLKPLAAWTRDLIARTDQLEGWWTAKMPTVYWLPGLTYPTGFLTALLQTTARKNALAIDSLVWDFPIVNSKPEDVLTDYAVHYTAKEDVLADTVDMALAACHCEWRLARGWNTT